MQKCLALLCILLVLLVGAAHFLHSHGGVESSSSGCSLCAVAHLSALAAPILSKPVLVRFFRPLRLPQARPALSCVLAYSLYVRPPPALTTHA